MKTVATEKRILAILLSAILLCELFSMTGSVVSAADEMSIETYDVELEYYTCTYDGTAKTPGVTVRNPKGLQELTQDVDYCVEYGSNTDTGWISVTVKGIGQYTGAKTTFFEVRKDTDIQADRLFGEKKVKRIYGKNRYLTSMDIALELKGALGIDYFDNIIVTYGGNYPDALSGGYLAKVKNAPILTVDKAVEKDVRNFIEKYLAEGGTVYILGGEAVIPKSFQESLKKIENKNVSVERLDGKNRYETNLKILNEAGVDKEPLLICSSNGYADSLSASAVGLPVMLVGTTLLEDQKDYLKELSSDFCYIIGGNAAVSPALENSIKSIQTKEGAVRTTHRLAGSTRYQTSVKVAETFFDNRTENVVFAYALNFPDGLSGGRLAGAIGAPLILVENSNTAAAKAFLGHTDIKRAVVLGGPTFVSDAAVNNIMKY
ncbi:MAG: cell wall-binding repeat-containing protein [Clostridiales bacterium]|nr:cell wall-binding repeat-containing protein [Candidatus Crickella merdequi]